MPVLLFGGLLLLLLLFGGLLLLLLFGRLLMMTMGVVDGAGGGIRTLTKVQGRQVHS
jgi:hypothetical protein